MNLDVGDMLFCVGDTCILQKYHLFVFQLQHMKRLIKAFLDKKDKHVSSFVRILILDTYYTVATNPLIRCADVHRLEQGLYFC